MKLAEKMDFAFESEQKHHKTYSFFDKDLKGKTFESQRFVVPWQIEERISRRIVVD